MPETSAAQPVRRPRKLRLLLIIAGSLLALLIILYFVGTSAAFFKGVILPRAGKSLGAQITVDDASISPFSQIDLKNLKVVTTGSEPLFQAEELRARYSLWSILLGTMAVDEVTLSTPVAHIAVKADGSSNLDPLLKGQPSSAAKPSTPATASKPPNLKLKNISIKNGTISIVQDLKSGGRQTAQLNIESVTLDRLENGQSGKLTTASSFKMNRPTNDVLEAKGASSTEFTLGPDLMPTTIKAHAEQQVLNAGGSLSQLADHRVVIEGDVSPTEVKAISERFFQGQQLLGELKVSGPLDLTKREGRLKIEASGIDRKLLNPIGAAMGIDFGKTVLDFVTEVALGRGGTVITARSSLSAANFSLTQNGQTTPTLDTQLASEVVLNTTQSSALLQQFTLDAKQNQQPLAHGSLTKPMAISWGKNAATAGDSSLTLAVTNVNLADWKPFLGGTVNSGRFSLQLDLNSQKSGGLLTLGVASRISDLSVNLGTNELTQAALAFNFNGQLADFKKVDLKDYKLDLTRQGQPALTVAGSAGYDGSLIHLQSQVHAVVFQLLGSGPEAPLDAGVKLDASMQGNQMDLRGLHVSLSPTQRAAKNEMDATGQFDLSTPGTTKGHLAIKADTLDLTQLYDALTAKGQTTKTGTSTSKRTSSKPSPAPSSSPGESEPDPILLPLQLTADATLDHVWLRDMSIENCQVTAKVDGGKINMDPCRMTLNGAPINATADLDLGVKGYTFNVALKMDKVPVAPIADTFSPENRGKYQGFLITDSRIKGAGITGPGLQKNLGGQVALTFTNAMLQVIGPKTKLLVVPIATLLRIPEIANTPIDWLNVQSTVEAGTIRLSHAEVQSAAFQAQTHGDIPIATVFTNSPLNLPVQFSLRRTLAESSNLVPPNTPTNANYVLLPDFVTVTGTIGDASSKVNALGLGALLAKPAEKIAEKFGGAKAGEAVKGIESLLTGQKAAGTNSSGTNKPPKFNPLDLLKKP